MCSTLTSFIWNRSPFLFQCSMFFHIIGVIVTFFILLILGMEWIAQIIVVILTCLSKLYQKLYQITLCFVNKCKVQDSKLIFKILSFLSPFYFCKVMGVVVPVIWGIADSQGIHTESAESFHRNSEYYFFFYPVSSKERALFTQQHTTLNFFYSGCLCG